jgi:hypothetical protein
LTQKVAQGVAVVGQRRTMKKLVAGFTVVFALAVPLTAQAKCYAFDKQKGFNVCVQGDSFADRDKAAKICKDVKKADCGGVSSYSSSCSGECYDESGKKSSSLSGYN